MREQTTNRKKQQDNNNNNSSENNRKKAKKMLQTEKKISRTFFDAFEFRMHTYRRYLKKLAATANQRENEEV